MKKASIYTTTLLIAVIFSACTRPSISVFVDQKTVSVNQTVIFEITKSKSATVLIEYGDGEFEDLGGLNDKYLEAVHKYKSPGTYSPTVTAFVKDQSQSAGLTIKVE